MENIVLQLNGLGKRYEDKVVVDRINLKVKKGEAIGLLGPNGAGKSTIIKMLVGNIKPSSGSMTLFGYDKEKEMRRARRRIGFVPQDLALYSDLKVWENIELFAGLYGLKGASLKDGIDEVLEMVGLEKERDKLVRNLSEGMKRRLNMACALTHSPEILIFDEPTVAIDPQSRRFILEKIKQIHQKGCTILYTSHYMEEVEYLCERIAILNHGKMIALGTKKELVSMVSNENDDSLTLEEVFIRLTGKEFHLEE